MTVIQFTCIKINHLKQGYCISMIIINNELLKSLSSRIFLYVRNKIRIDLQDVVFQFIDDINTLFYFLYILFSL